MVGKRTCIVIIEVTHEDESHDIGIIVDAVSALDFSETKSNRYQYQLEGYDSDWVEADFEHRSAAYGNLWPGNYTLHVRGSNRLGQWSAHQYGCRFMALGAGIKSLNCTTNLSDEVKVDR